MLKKIGLGYIPLSKIVTGLEIIMQSDGSYEMRMLVLKNNKTKLSTVQQQDGITDFEKIAQLIEPKCPLVLILNGKGIIHKKVVINDSDTPASLLNKVLPNAQLADFTIQTTAITASEVFVSVIRTNVLDEIIQQLVAHKITSLAGCLLGPFILTDVLPLLDSGVIVDEQLNVGNFQLTIKEQRITDIATNTNNNDQEIRIGEERIANNMLIAFAGAVSYFIRNTDGILNSGTINQVKENYDQKRKFEFRGWVLMAATFLILMINYFIFNHYWSEGQEMNARLALVESSLKHYEKLKEEFSQKKGFLEQNGMLESSRTSYYADQLASTLPASIQWTDVNINPLKKKNANDETTVLFFENKTISISGNCKNSNELNNWMKDIKNQTWVNNVVMMDYKQDNENENGIFLIQLTIK